MIPRASPTASGNSISAARLPVAAYVARNLHVMYVSTSLAETVRVRSLYMNSIKHRLAPAVPRPPGGGGTSTTLPETVPTHCKQLRLVRLLTLSSATWRRFQHYKLSVTLVQNSMHGVAAGLLTWLCLMPSSRRRRRSGPLSPCALSPAQSYSRSTV